MLSEAQIRVARLLGVVPDEADEQMVEVIDECLKIETNKGPLAFARHMAWVVKNYFWAA